MLLSISIEMVRHTRPDRGEGELAGIGLGIGDQIGDRLHRQLRIDDQHERRLREQGQRNEVAERVIRQALVERNIDRHGRCRRHQQRVAVGRGLLHRDRGDDAAGAGLVLDDNALAEPLLQILRHHPRQKIGAATRRERIDDRNRPRGIVLRECCRRRQQQQANEPCEARLHDGRPSHRAERRVDPLLRNPNGRKSSR
jgi:hypothetical protein